MPIYVPGKLTFRRTYIGDDDPDAQAYIAAVEAADAAAGQPGGLETPVKTAIHSFVKGCKADGTWPALKASCILAGARTLNGALVPLLPTMPAPTRFGAEGGWNYNRKTGLEGNGTDNHLNSNRLLNAQPQNSIHLACWVNSAGAPSRVYMGALTSLSPLNSAQLSLTSQGQIAVFLNGDLSQNEIPINVPTFFGASRASPTNFTVRVNSVNNITTDDSTTPGQLSVAVFARNTTGAISGYTAARLSFYSIGESLDLALLDARVSALINAIGAAIP